MEGYPPNPLVPTGYINSTTPLFFPQPQITHVLNTPAQVYVSPQGDDDPANVGSITSPFATISAAIFYVTNLLPQPLTSSVCIFVAPGTYEGGFSVPDNVYLIGPANTPEPVIILGNIFAVPTESLATIGLQNLTLQGVTVAGAFYDANVEIINCKIQTDTIFSALTIAQEDPVVNASVYATECIFVATDAANVSVISGNTSEKTSLILDNCQLVTAGEEGSLIDMTGSLTVRNCSLLNTAAGTTLAPLIIAQSGATLVPVVSLEGSVLKYNDLQADVAGNKLAIRFNAPTQPITAKMTNCTLSVFLGAPNTDIVKNIGAQNVTMSQSANSCLLDGITIDATNMVLTSAFFLQGSPLAPPPSAGVSFLNTLEGSVTITGASGVSVGSAPGNTITISGSGVASLAGLTGTVTLSSPDASITIGATGNDIELTANGLISATAGDGIEITGTQDITIANTGILSVAVSTGLGITGTQDVTISNTGVLALTAGEKISITGENSNLTIANTGVLTVGSYVGDISITGGTGISIGGTEPTIEITNTGVTETVAGSGIGVSAGTGSVTISNTGVTETVAGDGIGVSAGTGSVTISNTGVLSVSAGTGTSVSTTTGVATVNSISRLYTLGGATIGGVITNERGTGSGNAWTQDVFLLASSIQINVPPGWAAGQSVGFDGYGYYNFDSAIASYWAIFYVTSTQATEQPLIGAKDTNDSIYAGTGLGQVYLPMNLTIPPTYLTSNGTITIRVYGRVTTANHYLVANPNIDARVSIVYP